MKLKHQTLIGISGAIWVAVGLFLLPLGLNFLGQRDPSVAYPLLDFFAPMTGGIDTAVVLLIAFSLMLGTMKAKAVLSKVVVKNVKHIRSFPNPTEFTNIYGIKYILLIGFMISLGMALRYFGVPKDVRGVIDVAVGSALITGGISYFRNMKPVVKEAS